MVLLGWLGKMKKLIFAVLFPLYVSATPVQIFKQRDMFADATTVQQTKVDSVVLKKAELTQAEKNLNPSLAKEDKPWSTSNKVGMGLLVAGSIADTITTSNGLKSGNCKEANPLLQSNSNSKTVAKGLALKLIVVGLSYYAVEYGKVEAGMLTGGLGILYLGVAAHNSKECK